MKSKKKVKLGNLSMVELYSNSKGRSQSFKKDHAQRILKLRGDWELVKDSPFTLTKDGIIELSSTGTSQESSE